MGGWWISLALTAALGATDPAIPPVRVDAVVTDAAGRPILDLKPADFELRENGVVQPIEQVTLPAGKQAQRVFAIFLDEYHVDSGAPTARIKEALSAFLDADVRPGDRAVVIRPLDPVTSLEFTSDKAVLRAALDTFSGRKQDYAPRSAFEEQYIGRAPAAVQAARRQIVASALREIVLRLGEASADRAVLVLVSDGFSRSGPRESRQMRVPDLQTLIRAASRAHVTVYAFSPSQNGQDHSDAATLEWLAAQTGGRSSADGSALSSNLERMSSDLDARYALTYRPSQADGRFHRLQVTAGRKGAVVRARPGYWAPFKSDLRLEEPLTSATVVPLRSLRRSSVIAVWTGITRGPEGGTRLEVTWEPARTPLPPQSGARRLLQRPEVVSVTARVKGGATLFSGEIAEVAGGSSSRSDVAAFTVPAGTIELDLTVRDGGGAELDVETRDVTVMDMAARKGPVLWTPRIVRARTAREFRALRENPSAAPSATRVFMRGDRLLIRVGASDAAGGQVAMRATVTNRTGGPMRDLEAAHTSPAGEVTYELPLAWLVPGEYAIAITARSTGGEATESVPFRVR